MAWCTRCFGAFVLSVLVPHSLLVIPAPGARASEFSDREAAVFAALCAADADCQRFPKRQWLRQKMVRTSDLACYGLRLEDGWARSPADQPVVILLHGFNSTPHQNAAFWCTIQEAGLPCGVFAYPNDYSIAAAGQLLSCELREFTRRHPRRKVALVCHSMGGLVARACVEDPRLDPGCVERLIMIAPPTHGSMIAHFAVGTDVWEHWIARREGGPWKRIRDSIIDGLGEAADELCPGSEFLCELNGRPIHPRIRYTILLGTGAHLNEAQLVWIRESVCEQLAKLPGGQNGAQRLSAIIDDIDELVDGKGDGVVAVKRGRLDGVDDTIILPFGHLSVTGAPDDDVLRDVQKVVLSRVR